MTLCGHPRTTRDIRPVVAIVAPTGSENLARFHIDYSIPEFATANAIMRGGWLGAMHFESLSRLTTLFVGQTIAAAWDNFPIGSTSDSGRVDA